MCDEPARDEPEALLQALHQLQSAILLLDEARAPEQIAAHVDLAVHQLADFLGVDNLEQKASTGPDHHQARLIN